MPCWKFGIPSSSFQSEISQFSGDNFFCHKRRLEAEWEAKAGGRCSLSLEERRPPSATWWQKHTNTQTHKQTNKQTQACTGHIQSWSPSSTWCQKHKYKKKQTHRQTNWHTNTYKDTQRTCQNWKPLLTFNISYKLNSDFQKYFFFVFSSEHKWVSYSVWQLVCEISEVRSRKGTESSLVRCGNVFHSAVS